jgi:aminoglycoside phosphotransferase (APT) family kinase protein
MTVINTVTLEDISEAARLSHLLTFTGNYSALMGGEFNDTFVLDCGTTSAVLRVARYKEVANLHREAKALALLNLAQVPRLIHYNDDHRIHGRPWIMEGYLEGKHTARLSLDQYTNLGKLLAEIHKIHTPGIVEIDYWAAFMEDYQTFGNEQFLLSHPDIRLRSLINLGRTYFQSHSTQTLALSLTHGDISLGNILVSREAVLLIDWEYARFRDPMADFSAIYYEDMEYNNGNWRTHIKPDEKTALFAGYTTGGGTINNEKIKIWINYDKLGNCLYLYWKIHQSGHNNEAQQLAQYNRDLDSLYASLKTNLRHP